MGGLDHQAAGVDGLIGAVGGGGIFDIAADGDGGVVLDAVGRGLDIAVPRGGGGGPVSGLIGRRAGQQGGGIGGLGGVAAAFVAGVHGGRDAHGAVAPHGAGQHRDLGVDAVDEGHRARAEDFVIGALGGRLKTLPSPVDVAGAGDSVVEVEGGALAAEVDVAVDVDGALDVHGRARLEFHVHIVKYGVGKEGGSADADFLAHVGVDRRAVGDVDLGLGLDGDVAAEDPFAPQGVIDVVGVLGVDIVKRGRAGGDHVGDGTTGQSAGGGIDRGAGEQGGGGQDEGLTAGGGEGICDKGARVLHFIADLRHAVFGDGFSGIFGLKPAHGALVERGLRQDPLEHAREDGRNHPGENQRQDKARAAGSPWGEKVGRRHRERLHDIDCGGEGGA